jgi:hypothetical protein
MASPCRNPVVGRGRALLLSAAAAVLLAGCGSSRLSHGLFVAKANAICADYHAKVAKLPLPQTVSAYEEYARRTLPLYRSALAQLEALRPPRSDEQAVVPWLARARGIEGDIVRIADAAHARHLPRLKAAVLRARDDDAIVSRLARRLGLDACARA